jgi:hypothetical protein
MAKKAPADAAHPTGGKTPNLPFAVFRRFTLTLMWAGQVVFTISSALTLLQAAPFSNGLGAGWSRVQNLPHYADPDQQTARELREEGR